MDCFTSQRLARQALKELCASGGCLEKGELCRRVAFGLNPDFMEVVFKDAQKFTLVTREETPSAAESENPLLVVATTKARLCPDHGNGTCEGRCRQLHLCRYFVCGGCRHEGTRRQCKFIHDFHSPHNLPILKEHGLESLKNDELCQLLLQNDSSLLPEVCPYYNKGDGPYGSCNFKKICVKLHICQYSLQGECRFGSNCKRSHDIFNSECYEKLEKRGMSKALISKISLTYRNAYAIKNNTSSPCKERRESSGQVPLTTNSREESDTICLYHIRKSCSFQEKCIRVHFQFPYRWQIFDGTHWKDLTNMEKIEQAYCDPFNDRFSFSRAGKSSNHPDIIFSNMACGPAKIRRLSTASSVTKPPHYILTTDWIWYWKDEYGVWNEYGKQDADHAAATLSSLDLEKAYQSEASPTLTFSAGKHKYEIDFKAMKQKNLHYLTVRSVHRRPRFVSLKEVEKKKTRCCHQSPYAQRHVTKFFQATQEVDWTVNDQPKLCLHFDQFVGQYNISESGAEQSKGGTTHIPTHWDQSALPDQGYKLITLSPSSNEYRKVQVNFQRTMPKSTIVYIKRIQNLALWEVYKWQKEQMKKANGGKDVDERLLFHGTSKDYIDAICVQNFDWRICGIHGTAYGKGSYFARDASYSDNYSKSNSSLKTMFLARVLVGEFTSGVSSYLRPPAKDSQNTFFYDSCVNSPLNPSIFVIFEKHQVYPEYLIEYTN